MEVMVNDLGSELWVGVSRILDKAYYSFQDAGYESKVFLNQNNANPLIGQLDVKPAEDREETLSVKVACYDDETIQVTADLVGYNIASNYLISIDNPSLLSSLEKMIDEFAEAISNKDWLNGSV